MAKPLDPKEIVTFEELAISGMWETAAIIEVLEKKGILKRQDIYEAIQELRRKNPSAKTPIHMEDPPEPSKASPKVIDGNAVIERILDIILEAGLSPNQAQEVLDRAKEAIDWGEKEVRNRLNH